MSAAAENDSPNVEIKPEDNPPVLKSEDTEPILKPEEVKEENTSCEPKINVSDANGIPKEEPKPKVESFDLTEVVVDSDVASKIMKQLEYYFGDRNLSQDKFMLREVTLDQGWIPLTTMLNFKRLAGICSDVNKIAKAVDSSQSSLIHINDEKTKIRRNPEKPLPKTTESSRIASNNKSVYAKGFPLTWTLDDAEAFFRSHGSTVYIKLRKDIEGKFKGSIFMEFVEQSDCDKFVALGSIKVENVENPVEIQLRNDYYAKKNQKERDSKNQKREAQFNDMPKKHVVPDVLEYEKGCVLKIPGLEGKDTSREDIKKLFSDCNLGWVTYNKGDEVALVRFDGDAKEALEKVKVDGKFVLSGLELEPSILEGDEEEAYHKEAAQSKANFFNKKRKDMSGGRGGNRGRGKRPRRF